MKNLSLILSVVTIVICLNNSLVAQQLGLQTLYNQNNYLINPAAVGMDDVITVDLNHRTQWVDIDEGPRLNTLLADMQFKGNHGVGLDVRGMKNGLIGNVNVKASYAYHLQLNDNMHLSAGVSLGMIQQKLNTQDAIASDYTDELLVQGAQSDVGFTSDIGLIFRWQKLKLGFAIPQVIASGLIVDYGITSSKYKLVNHMNFLATYEVYNSGKWVAYPSILYRNSGYKTHQVDISANAMWNDLLGFGLMYRSTYGFGGLLEVKIKDMYRLGYSYEFGAGNITGLSRGAHEIMIGIKFGNNSKDKVVVANQ
ncbi:MAG: PorP/SprF family type IX secretion system membrane protein [Crocinitomicaceae bacterium]